MSNASAHLTKSWPRQQRGLTLIGLLFIGVLLVFLGVVLAQVVPTVIEYVAISRAVDRAGQAATPAEARGLFDKTARIDDIKSISSRDLDISKPDDKLLIRFSYHKEIPLGGPVYLLIKYDGRNR